MSGGYKTNGTSYSFDEAKSRKYRGIFEDEVWSIAPDGRFGIFIVDDYIFDKSPNSMDFQ